METLLDQVDSGGDNREVKFLLTFVKEMALLSPTHGFRSLKEECTPGKHQDIETKIS